jgi:sulfate/thiosulfate transport system substrate-binding protein
MRALTRRRALGLLAAASGTFAAGCSKGPDASGKEQLTLLNVSYDPTRELYDAINKAFIAQWQAQSGEQLTIRQSHGGSGKQARAIIDGLEADVATLALAYDINELNRQGHLIPENWATRLPDNSAPYTSTIVFLVHKGNPKNIHTWEDLVRPGVQVITPNPKSSGGARWNYLAAWAWAAQANSGNQEKARDYMKKLFANVPVLDSGARGATVTFVDRGIGDVLLAWENEALLAKQNLGADKLEILIPPLSILAEPPVTVIDKVVDRRNTRKVAEAYLQYLYTDSGQQIVAQNFYRPRTAAIMQQFAAQFPSVNLVTIDSAFGGWDRAQHEHFDDGGSFDQIYGQ